MKLRRFVERERERGCSSSNSFFFSLFFWSVKGSVQKWRTEDARRCRWTTACATTSACPPLSPNHHPTDHHVNLPGSVPVNSAVSSRRRHSSSNLVCTRRANQEHPGPKRYDTPRRPKWGCVTCPRDFGFCSLCLPLFCPPLLSLPSSRDEDHAL